MILATDPGTAVFGLLCAAGGALVLIFRRRWHRLWWQGSRLRAPDDAEFERGVYMWGTVAFGAVVMVLGVGIAVAAITT